MRARLLGTSLAVLALAMPAMASAKAPPLSIRNSFRIGSSGVMCTAQNAPADARISGMFDRSYRLTCRDAAGAVGSLIAVRREVAPAMEPSALPGVALDCAQPGSATIEGLGDVLSLACRDPRSRVDYRRYLVRRGGVSYFVEGLAGYDPALRLALASVATDSPVPGEVRVASTEVSDPAAFARVQAGQLDQSGARDEGYLRNNGGSFAESAEFFEALSARDRKGDTGDLAEALANQGLQQSNLGNFAAAKRLFEQAQSALAADDAVTQRRLRNYRVIDLLNQKKPDAALAQLASPVPPVSANFDRDKLAMGEINLPLSEQINRENDALLRLGGADPGLTATERAEILDAQGVALSGTAQRLKGRYADALEKLAEADRRLTMVRGGRVDSIGWMRSEIQIEQALLNEAQGRKDQAAAEFDRAIATLAAAFPQSPALLAAQARKAAFLGRAGDAAAAKALYASVIDQSAMVSDSGATLRDMLSPYLGLLAKDGDATSAASMFIAAQVLQRPGVAQTQAVLARELSEGNDDAAALFRLSVTRSRDIARTDAEVTRLSALATPSAQEQAALAAAKDTLASLQRDQTELVSKLAAYPRYNVLAPQRVTLAELQQSLQPGEGYYKLVAVGEDLYALFATAEGAQTFKLDLDRPKLAVQVQAIRDSIVKVENGRQVNYPFDLDRARDLYRTLFGPIDRQLPAVKHLVFEPDAGMLQLPPSVLVTDDKGIAAYKKRTKAPDADAFDFTGIAWLGRGREVSIAVSPRGFLDLRKLAPSRATKPYLGLGHNAVPAFRPVTAVADECDWPLVTWQRPISADELVFAKQTIGGASDVRTDMAFSDSELLSDRTLDQYRVLHFATHGLVTAPRADCPARPALVTSFGDQGSDGLLTFREIFDLKLDADLVILSACDTAGMATVAASREAGVTTGGNYALDGLVRAFVGAGARSVIASHWPVPDDFNATKRLIGGVVGARPGEPLAQALEEAQVKLMDDPNTSHPFYWAAFIILGDGAKPLVQAGPAATRTAAR
ncbi:CHAT domain-containing protein [Novosphingobium olei]|uniref:CHAT domain-containing protein n=1 Tax=Novosphingobium olei TaxID=2728851 RepID=A0A7Y0BMX9_9SPHN|nr:CHAT domain-containing protein [Novosphingobium olei]NML93447.1 CHAT domain-containing protein [Novosphingobium olei]